MRKTAIRVGRKCSFVPAFQGSYGMDNPAKIEALSVTGTITYVNHAHRFFRVEFPAGKGDVTLSECFKF